jgi:methionine biosynthesis protein MetW
LQLLFTGSAPKTKQLPFHWYDSPNIHVISLKDYDCFCADLGIRIEGKIALGKKNSRPLEIWPNLFASQAVYITSKHPQPTETSDS